MQAVGWCWTGGRGQGGPLAHSIQAAVQSGGCALGDGARGAGTPAWAVGSVPPPRTPPTCCLTPTSQSAPLAHTHTCTHARTHVCKCTCTHVCTHTHAHMHAHTQHTHTRTHARMLTHLPHPAAGQVDRPRAGARRGAGVHLHGRPRHTVVHRKGGVRCWASCQVQGSGSRCGPSYKVGASAARACCVRRRAWLQVLGHLWGGSGGSLQAGGAPGAIL